MIILGKTWGDLGKSIAKNLGPHVFRGQSVFFVISEVMGDASTWFKCSTCFYWEENTQKCSAKTW